MFFKAKNIFIVFAVLLGLVFGSGKVWAESSEKYNELQTEIDLLSLELEKCMKNSGEEMVKCANNIKPKLQKALSNLEQYKKEIGTKAEELQKDIKSLKNQIGYLDAKVEKTEVEIRITQQEIDMLNLDITQIEEQIKNTEEEIQNTENKIEEVRQRLADTVKKIYEYDAQNLVKITLASGALSDFFDEISYVENLQKSLSINLGQLKQEKKNLENKKSALEDQKASLAEKRREVSEKIDSFNKTIAELDAEKKNKATLLEITKGDEEEYQKILKNIESQKREVMLLKEKADIASKDLNASWWYYNQKNYQDIISNCYYKDDYGLIRQCTISTHGCAITSVAMVFTNQGKSKTPPQVLQESKFDNYGNIYWPYPFKSSGHCSGCVNWKIIDENIAIGRPVIVFIRVSGSEGHYVVIYGKEGEEYLVNDPYFGQGIYLSESFAGLSQNSNGISISKNNIDQMVLYSP